MHKFFVLNPTNFSIKMLTFTIFIGSFWIFIARFIGENILFIFPAFKIFIIAALLLIAMLQFVFYNQKKLITKEIMMVEIILFFLFYLVFYQIYFFSYDFKKSYTPLQGGAFFYIPMILVGYFNINNFGWIKSFSHKIVLLSLFISAISIIEWILGIDFLKSIGMNLEIGNGASETHYGSAQDIMGQKIFRTFSTLMSHYEVCAFLIFSSLLNIFLLVSKQKNGKRFLFDFLIITFALLTTYNITGWIIFICVHVLAFLIFSRYNIYKISPIFLTIFLSISALVIGKLAFQFIVRLIVGIDFTSGRGSFSARIFFLENSFLMIKENPWGWGWDKFDSLPYDATADNFFVWITVLGGILFFILLALIYLIPLCFNAVHFKRIYIHNKTLFCFNTVLFLWVLFGFLNGVSNYFISHDYATSIFFWFSIGLLLKIPHYSRLHHEQKDTLSWAFSAPLSRRSYI